MAEEYEQTFSDLSNKTPHESRREEDENIDEILSQATLSEFKFRKDDDMSEAQSEFVDSSKLNVDKLGLAKHKKVYKDEESSHKGHR